MRINIEHQPGVGRQQTADHELRLRRRGQVLQISVLLLSLLLPVLGGCAELINPFRDDLPGGDLITTASARRVREAGLDAGVRLRGWDASVVQAQDPGVTHWPLWWEDFVEDSGSDDGQFAWTWRDYAAFGYCPARQIVNTVALPVSWVVDPPGAIRCSDGVMGKQALRMSNHDAVACSGVAIPPDIIEAYGEFERGP